MEDELVLSFQTLIAQFAEENDIKVVYPNTDLELETIGVEGSYINADVENETLFLRPTVTPIDPDTRGIKRGWSNHVWLLQISIFVRNGQGPYVAAQITDKLRDVFYAGNKISGETYKYTQINTASLKAPIGFGGWSSNPVLFRVQTVR